MAFSDAQSAFYVPHIVKIPDVLVPVHNTALAAPLADLPLDMIIQSLNDANVHQYTPESLEIMPSGRLHMLFLIKGRDGSQSVLTLSPPAGIRLLRHERWSIRSEAIVLLWLSSISGQWRRDSKTIVSHDEQESDGSEDGESRWQPQPLTGSLHNYLPRLTKHGSIGAGSHILYNLSTPSRGTAVSNLPTLLTPDEQRAVDFQTGQLLRRVSLYSSPNRMFGMAANVLPQITTSLSHACRGNQSDDKSSISNLRSDRWSEAFHILLESVLRDAEDLLLTISYDRIRYQFSRFRHLLDSVKCPRFVAIDIGEDTNILVQRYCAGKHTEAETEEGEEEKEEEEDDDDPDYEDDEEGQEDEEDQEEEDDDDCCSRKLSESKGTKSRITVTGLRDWSHCIFGDPLMASVFSRNPSPEFIRGFHSRLEVTERGMADYASAPIEDQAYAHVRLLLYECLHSVLAIVKEGCRWRHDSHARELAGRKKLLDVLARLDDLNDQGHPKHDRPITETIPPKRTKSQDC